MDKVVLLVALSSVLLPAALIDVRSRRIPNLLSLAGIVLGLVLNLFFFGLSGAVTAGAGLLLAFAISLPLWLLGWAGAGDVKLVSAVGAMVGVGLVFPVLAGIALAGGGVSLLYLLAVRMERKPFFASLRPTVLAGKVGPALRVSPQEGGPERRKGVPYALPVALGALAVVVYMG